MLPFILMTLAYLLGSIQTAFVIGKIFYKKDIREFGSKNSGATNALRVFGMHIGLIVLIIDILKGWIVTSFTNIEELQMFLAISVISGHIFPVFTRFKGGKGVAVAAGCFIAIDPFMMIIPTLVYVFTFIKWRISSVSSLSATLSMIISLVLFNESLVVCLITFVIIGLIFWKHEENIKRILEGKEKKLF